MTRIKSIVLWSVGQLAISVCCLLPAQALQAQEEFSVTRNISTAEGLTNDFVTKMAIDDRSYVWVGTEAGISCIAGKTCQKLAGAEHIADRLITALCWHKEAGCMLIGADRGLTIYNPAHGTLQRLDDNDGLKMASINDIVATKNGAWLVYGNGQIQLLDCKTLRPKLLKLSKTRGNRCVMDDGQGHLFIGHSQHGMTIVNISESSPEDTVVAVNFEQNFQQQKGDSHSLPGNNVRCIFQDREQRIWVGTDNGLALFHPTTGTFTKVTDPGDRYDYNIYDIKQMKDDRLWVATDIGGIKVVNTQRLTDSERKENLDGKPAMSSDNSPLYYEDMKVLTTSLNTRIIAEDEYGNVWIGNHSTGVDFISAARSDFNLLAYTDKGNSYAAVYAITNDKEQNLWTASENNDFLILFSRRFDDLFAFRQNIRPIFLISL